MQAAFDFLRRPAQDAAMETSRQSARAPLFEHTLPFDPSCGYDRAALLAVTPPPGPDDFDAFWQQTRAECDAVPLNLQVRPLESPSPAHRLHALRFSTLGGVKVGAWLVTPVDGNIDTAAVVGHGYGGRDAPDWPIQRGAFLFFCAPGFHLSADPELPNECYQHVLHGITHRDTYIIRYCVAAIWSSARALETYFERTFSRLYYFGGSFGGGLGALAMPHDARFTKCVFNVPTFGHQPIRLTCRGQGSGEAVRLYAEEHPEVIDVLHYYDAGTAATRITIPNVTAPALFDPAVAPPGQFAVSNPMARHGHQFILSAGHFEYADAQREDRALNQLVDSFIWGDASTVADIFGR